MVQFYEQIGRLKIELEWLKVTSSMDNRLITIDLDAPRCPGLRRDIDLNVYGNVPDVIRGLKHYFSFNNHER